MAEPCPRTSPWVSRFIIFLYFCAVIIWFLLVWALSIPLEDIFDFIILFIPIFLFGLAIGTVGNETMTMDQEAYIFRTNYSSALTLLLTPILLWASARLDHNRNFLVLIISATVICLLSFYDFWISGEYFPVAKHLRSILQTISITLMIYALKIFCIDRLRSSYRDEATVQLDEYYTAGTPLPESEL